MKVKHKCEKCAEYSEWFAEMSKWLAEKCRCNEKQKESE